MNLLEFYVTLRRELMTVISGVENSRGGIFSWDDTTPNQTTRRKLSEIHQRYVQNAARFGLYVITRHSDCGNENHAKRGAEGYIMDPIDDVSFLYRDTRFRWTGGQVFQGKKMCTCPCSPSNKPTLHHVIEDVLYDVMGNQKTCQAMDAILQDVYQAMEASTDGKPRSGIREYLLRAILKINDAIIPVPVDDFIEHQLKMTGLAPSCP